MDGEMSKLQGRIARSIKSMRGNAKSESQKWKKKE